MNNLKTYDTVEDYFQDCSTKIYQDREMWAYWEHRSRETPEIRECWERALKKENTDDLLLMVSRLSVEDGDECVAHIGEDKSCLIKQELHFTLKQEDGKTVTYRYYEYHTKDFNSYRDHIEEHVFHLILGSSLA